MNLFDSQLLRLKQALGVTKDQEVAAALGMTRAAFSYRKSTNNFPEERLAGLLVEHPELDLAWVLTGERDAEGSNFVKVAGELGLRASDVAKAVATGVARAREERVQVLVGLLAHCDDEDIALLTKMASRFAAGPLNRAASARGKKKDGAGG